MRRFIERYTSDPIRGLGRIARGNVRQGLRDMAPSAKIAAAFIPGGALATAGLGAAAGALEQGRGASFGDIAGGAARGAGTAMALRGAAQQAQGLFTGGGAGAPGLTAGEAVAPTAGGARNLPMAQFPDIGSAGSAASLPPLPEGGLPVNFGFSDRGRGVMQGVTSGAGQRPEGLPVNFGFSPRGRGAMQGVTSALGQQGLSQVPGIQGAASASMSGLPGLARSPMAEQTSRSLLGGLGGAARQAATSTAENLGGGGTFERITGGLGKAATSVGQFSKDYPELAGGIARGAGTAFAGARQASALERQIALQERQDERAATAEEEERERRRRVAELLAPLFQQMQQRQPF
jgi:hypothetical protein